MGLPDILEILTAHLGRTVNPEQVTVRTEPCFEIEVEGAVGVFDVRPGVMTAAPKFEKNQREADTVYDDADTGTSMEELLRYSRDIEQDIRNHGRR